MPIKTAVAFSGGLDSTFVMWKLLTETDEEITAVYLDNQFVADHILTAKSYIQFIQAQKVVDELQKIRPFTFVKYSVKPEDITDEVHHKILLFIQYAAPLINDGTYDKMVHGAAYEAHHQKLVSHLEYTPTYYAAKRLFDKLCTRGIYSNPLVADTWYTKYNRAYAFRDLPENFKSLVSTCDFLTYEVSSGNYVACNKCSKCLIDKKTKEMMAAGKTPDEILQWKEAKSYEYGDGTNMSPIIHWINTEVGAAIAPTKEQLQQSAADIKNHHNFTRASALDTGIWKGLFVPE